MGKHFLAFVFICSALRLSAQQSAIYFDAEQSYRKGIELYDQQKFGAAQKEFDAIVKKKNISFEARSNSCYYGALCAVELTNRDAEERLLDFLARYPESPAYNDATFALANFYSASHHWKKAIEWYEKTNKGALSAKQQEGYEFKTGYAYYMLSDYEKSSKHFYNVKDGSSVYAPPALYYYAHIMYVQKNYETALTNFEKLKSNEAFAPVVPYYIAQIYYLQGKYDALIGYGVPVIEAAGTKNAMEIERMVGEAYFKQKDYARAIPYMYDYEKNSGASTFTDFYQLGYCYVQTKQCEKAISEFQKLTNGNDSLAQNSYYQLATCFVKVGNLQSARNAFQSAAKMDFDKVVKEESQFAFAKLTYELNYQSNAVTAFKSFITTYPNSIHADEANEILINVYLSTKNYRDALEAIEKSKYITDDLKTAYQKVAYYRGVELFLDLRYKEAIDAFNTSLKNRNDRKLSAAAQYWKGEAQYKTGDYNSAIDAYTNFLFNPEALTLDYYQTVNYNLGYCYMKKEEYSNAQEAFRKYLKSNTAADVLRYNDALLRTADAFFMLKDNTNAMDFYDQAIAGKAKSIDYALYQKAILLGIKGSTNEKIDALKNILVGYPKSLYFDDALYEAAKSSMQLGLSQQAMIYYKKIISDYPNSSYVKKAMVGLGLVYYNSKDDASAIRIYKDVITKYPNTNESKEALVQLKNIAISQNRVEEYLDYAKTIPNSNITEAQRDSLVFESAELNYTNGNCTGAIKDFDNYLNKYPVGAFRLDASYYKADCQFRNNLQDDALPSFEYVISLPKNSFTEKSLLNAAYINYKQKKFDKAMEEYERLETLAEVKENIPIAQAGQMRCALKLYQYERATVSAQKIIAAGYDDKNLINEAHMISARAALAKPNYAAAKTEFEVIAKLVPSEMAAEAIYELAFIENKLKNYKPSSALIMTMQKQVPGYDYWIAKGFILLGDNYLATQDTFQAKETYKSIVGNYQRDPSDPDDLREIARGKLFEVITAEEYFRNREMKKPDSLGTDAPEMDLNKQ